MSLMWNVILIKVVNVITWMGFEIIWKILLLLFKNRRQGNWYVLKSVLMNHIYCADNNVCTSSLMKNWSPGMGNICDTDSYIKMVIPIDESAGMSPLIISTKILFIWWKVTVIKKVSICSSVWWLKVPGSYCWFYSDIQEKGMVMYLIQFRWIF